MGNFEMRYPVHELSRAEAQFSREIAICNHHRVPSYCAKRVRLGVLEQNSAAAQPSDFSQLKALFTTPLDDRQMVRSLKEGTLRGVSRSDMKPSHAIACGVAMTIASFILFFL